MSKKAPPSAVELRGELNALNAKRVALNAGEQDALAAKKKLALRIVRADPSAIKESGALDARLAKLRAEVETIDAAKVELSQELAAALAVEEQQQRERLAEEANEMAETIFEHGQALAKALQKVVTTIRDLKTDLAAARHDGLGGPSSEVVDIGLRDLLRDHVRMLGDMAGAMPNRRWTPTELCAAWAASIRGTSVRLMKPQPANGAKSPASPSPPPAAPLPAATAQAKKPRPDVGMALPGDGALGFEVRQDVAASNAAHRSLMRGPGVGS